MKAAPKEIIISPYLTEKGLSAIDGTKSQDFKDGNKLEFLVRRDATKKEIKEAFEKLFEAKVAKVNVKITKEGKHAIIKVAEGYDARDIGMRIGIF
ncbi:MAG: 50S ribosomal protein L23 [Thermoplasmata archaeon]|nr:50S ribosomal protein L23 [Thermoplasmata archaeon]